MALTLMGTPLGMALMNTPLFPGVTVALKISVIN